MSPGLPEGSQWWLAPRGRIPLRTILMGFPKTGNNLDLRMGTPEVTGSRDLVHTLVVGLAPNLHLLQ